MSKQSRQTARDTLQYLLIPLDRSYYTLSFSEKEGCRIAAQRCHYRKPATVKGSTAFMFYEFANL